MLNVKWEKERLSVHIQILRLSKSYSEMTTHPTGSVFVREKKKSTESAQQNTACIEGMPSCPPFFYRGLVLLLQGWQRRVKNGSPLLSSPEPTKS